MQYGENLTIEFTPGVQQISSLTFELWQMRKQVQTIISAIVTIALVALDFLSVILIVAVFVVLGSRLLFLFRCCALRRFLGDLLVKLPVFLELKAPHHKEAHPRIDSARSDTVTFPSWSTVRRIQSVARTRHRL